MKLILCDVERKIIEAWEKEFSGVKDVEVVREDIFQVKADAISAPGNSFGWMEGGLDLKIVDFFGRYKPSDEHYIRDRVEEKIYKEHYGELIVGNAIVVETDNVWLPYLVYAPTMREPQNVKDSINAYLAMRAALIAVSEHNKKHPGSINTVLVPGLATGNGGMAPEKCAEQMRKAYQSITIGEHPRLD